jgi:hypothetical protein
MTTQCAAKAQRDQEGNQDMLTRVRAKEVIIERILTAPLSTLTALPVAAVSTLTRWLNGYAGSPGGASTVHDACDHSPAAVRGGLGGWR